MKRLFRKLHSACNRFSYLFARVKTRLYYSMIFQSIGAKTVVYTPMRLICPENMKLGSRVYIYKHSRIETITDWYKQTFNPVIEIGDSTSFEQGLHMTCAERISVGKSAVILANVLITDIDHEYAEIDKKVMEQPIITAPVVIGDYCFIGMGSRIFPGTKLGEGCVVGSNSVVTGEYPAYCVIVGAPAKIIKRYDTESGQWRKTNSEGEFI